MAEPQFKLRDGAVAWQRVDGDSIVLDLAASAYLERILGQRAVVGAGRRGNA